MMLLHRQAHLGRRQPAPGVLAAVAAVALLLVAGCSSSGSGGSSGSSTASGSGGSASGGCPTQSTATVDGLPTPACDPAVAALVPASVRGKTVRDEIYNNYPPDDYVDGGKLIGFGVDLTNAVAAVSGLKISISPSSDFSSTIPGLQSGRLDLSTTQFSITPERQKAVDFVTDFQTGRAYLTRSDYSGSIASASDLCGLTVAADTGAVALTDLQRFSKQCTSAGKPAIKISTFAQDTLGNLAVQNGRVQAHGADLDTLAYAVLHSNGQLKLQPFVYSVAVEGFAFPNDSNLTTTVAAAVNALIADGTYAKILKKWDVASGAIKKSTVVK